MVTPQMLGSLSPNEKCATFIGWSPKPKNQGHVHPQLGTPISTTARCPDMSKPENYMRALEAFVEKYPYGLVDFRGGWGSPKFALFLGLKWGTQRAAKGTSDESIGEAMIAAFADLYNIECDA